MGCDGDETGCAGDGDWPEGVVVAIAGADEAAAAPDGGAGGEADGC